MCDVETCKVHIPKTTNVVESDVVFLQVRLFIPRNKLAIIFVIRTKYQTICDTFYLWFFIWHNTARNRHFLHAMSNQNYKRHMCSTCRHRDVARLSCLLKLRRLNQHPSQSNKLQDALSSMVAADKMTIKPYEWIKFSAPKCFDRSLRSSQGIK